MTCGETPTIGFLNDMPRLGEFRCVDTNVIDGDLGPLLRLKSVGSSTRSTTPTPMNRSKRSSGRYRSTDGRDAITGGEAPGEDRLPGHR